MLSVETIEKKVVEIGSKYLPDKSPDRLYSEEYELDSLSLVNFVIELEDAFEIDIDDELIQSDHFRNTKNVVSYIGSFFKEETKMISG